jgi:hypothetical protein
MYEKRVGFNWDVDGTMVPGPFSGAGLFWLIQHPGRAFESEAGKSAWLNQALQVDVFQGIERRSAQTLTERFEYGMHALRQPRPEAIELVRMLSSAGVAGWQLYQGIVSGRQEALLGNLTETMVTQNEILQVMAPAMFLKPGSVSSDVWKMAVLMAQGDWFDAVALIENDLRTALRVGSIASEKELPLKVFLVESVETHPLILKMAGWGRGEIEAQGVVMVKKFDEVVGKIETWLAGW